MADKAKGKRGRNTRSRTPPVRIPIRKNQKAVKNKSNARATQLFSLPVSPLTKENGSPSNAAGSGNKKSYLVPQSGKNFDDENEENSDLKDDDSDENNSAEPVRF